MLATVECGADLASRVGRGMVRKHGKKWGVYFWMKEGCRPEEPEDFVHSATLE